jgi:cytochrome c-type biogenesis protein CcmH/NrfG
MTQTLSSTRQWMTCILLALGLLMGAGAFAQTTLNPAAREALQQGEAAVLEALRQGIEPYPDRPFWRDAIRHGREALRQEPGHPVPLRFLAEVYSETRWYGPAWNTWMQFVDAGGRLDSEARDYIAAIGTELGYTRYTAGEPDEALRYYHRVIDLVPDYLEAYVWAGRILLETERPRQAIAYWQEVVDRDPQDQRAQYFLELAQDQARYGIEAATAFREGIAYYEQGQLSQARERFARATSLNAEYAQAWAWLGRVEFERGNYRNAANYYDTALEFDPGNETYRYFRDEARNRLG